MTMHEAKASLSLDEYKALRDSLREKRELLPQAALAEALRVYLAHATQGTDQPPMAHHPQDSAGH
jgi:hypothetical protein